jgi:transcriptional regulator with XRE-family HTH domain
MSTNEPLTMDDFPSRLREQRQALKLTQAEFGEACGVKRRAQAAYEAGERIPDASYLLHAGRAGADLKYLLTGVVSNDAEKERLGVDWLVRTLCELLAIPPGVAEAALTRAANIHALPPDAGGKPAAIKGTASDLLRASRRLAAVEVQLQLDRDLLVDVVREQEEAWTKSGKRPSAVQRSHRFATIYEDALKNGQINRDLIDGGHVEPLRTTRSKAA